MTSLAARPNHPPAVALMVGECPLRVWSLPNIERWRRALQKLKLPLVQKEEITDPATPVLLVRADYVVTESVLAALVAQPGTLLIEPLGEDQLVPIAVYGESWAGIAAFAEVMTENYVTGEQLEAFPLRAETAAQIGADYNKALRKRGKPIVASLLRTAPLAVERLMFADAYKGVTDIVTKYVWPWPAFWVTRWAARYRLSPNMVTWASLLCVFAAMGLFWHGYFGLGLAIAWLMTFLDTVDGKLARVTYQSSPLGNAFDHGIDLIHPPFWWWAWWAGLSASGHDTSGLWANFAFWVVIIGYGIGRLMEGYFIWRHHLEIHAWQRPDSLFRLVTARRNPNLLILMAAVIAGNPYAGFIGMAGWTVFSLGFHAVRIGMAERDRRLLAGSLQSWLSVR